MNRKLLFDTVRRILRRGFTRAEVAALDAACDAATGMPSRRLGTLSERYESGGRGPATVSGGRGDPGGVSYGTYQLSSRAGTLAAFLAAEGSGWAAEFAGAAPGTPTFTRRWQRVAERDAAALSAAEHAFIARTHYRPAVAAVARETGLDLDTRHDAVRDAVWSVAVQHGGAARILAAAVRRADAGGARSGPAYDRRLIEAIYAERSAYVQRISGAKSLAAGERATLSAMVHRRYPAERSDALAMLDGAATV